LISLSSSGMVTPNYWTTRTPASTTWSRCNATHRIDKVDDLRTTALGGPGSAGQLLGDLATVDRRTTAVVANHSNIQPTFTVRADVQGRDLGSVSDEMTAIVKAGGAKLPPGSTVVLRGQVESMQSSFSRLGLGLLFAAVLVYFLMVVNFSRGWTRSSS
jgi:multidrug efflux pump subunit AcrB